MRNTTVLAIPSVISLSRVVLAIAFVAVNTPEVRALVALIAALTDFLDGWIARAAKLETRMGALIDPITDRLFMATALLVLLTEGSMTIGQCALLLSRDIATSVGFIVAKIVSWLRPVPFQARMLGKVVTVLQFIAVIVALLWPVWIWRIVLLTGAVSVFAIWDYTLALWRARATA